ncbi:phenylalanine--tRNA ligase subunit beta [Pelagibacterium halotolerans]|uniref:Phenylalanine--tRNA ligase beta subunit n=1 Tax=Pelagibacterium halotolerans (strain DSM 22347 / JCM 15775 / CGMCC 1.7692 / B2) TaxID=1082931 RepID=G4RBQ4_PELHB|nr:phenylalanine--tRNA ligase subunit beta [Pelagibacterium halotolerans]AEQ53695.1 phenylalanyl-tRNA synthetase beta chain [Pelagibacterium halotolerans B2]QJR20141.1 phenylalanine--tRNA ligase subunit beta [Pelagibacterium halotolerans]SEA78986.1 phenylalanyl-tRNA synthetase beta subunit [Pelagibacterium halotolerans]
MKFTLSWLKEHLETTATNAEIIDTLTMVGLEVEEVTDSGAALKDFVTAHVVSAEQHPNADKLRVCKVDAGTGELIDVVCGAPNARTGMKSVFAFAGTYIPGKDITIGKGNIRGQVSNGMLCSNAELELSDDHDGIIELPEDAPIGVPYPDYAGINEVVIDVGLTPNRGDCAGVHGIARDLAAAGLGQLKDTSVEAVPATAGASPIAVRVDGDICRMFSGRLVRNVTNGPSPQWMQDRLRAVGLRPINALVDITNYVSLDRARPLHVYDADKLTGNIAARMGRTGESFAALDGKTYAVDETMCVIADDQKVLGLGGIIGGEETGSSDETTNVFIECAWFEPTAIAAAGRKTGINSDARYRFERTVDPESVKPGIELATRLVMELCGGEPAETVIAGHVGSPGTVIDFPFSEIERLTGLTVAADEATAILTRLGFEVSGSGEVVRVGVPSWRPDVTMKADLVEEVMRIVGVDRVPVEPLPRLSGVAPKMLTPIQNRRRIARRALAARGMDEAMTWSFISTDFAQAFGGGSPQLRLANAIASDMTDMRPSLLPGLLSGAARNGNRGFDDVALFEVGQVFLSDAPEGQRNYATGIRTGTAGPSGAGRHWQGKADKVGVYDAKADLGAVLDALGVDIDKVQVVAEPAQWSHPGRGGRIQLGPKLILGWFGELHPVMAEKFDLDGPVAAFEIDLDALPEPRKKATKARPPLALSALQPVRRDFAFVVDTNVEAAGLLRAARGADKALISDVTIFDVFAGAHVGEGNKSVAIEVTLQPRDKTLTDEEIEAVAGKIVAAVEKATGGVLRG